MKSILFAMTVALLAIAPIRGLADGSNNNSSFSRSCINHGKGTKLYVSGNGASVKVKMVGDIDRHLNHPDIQISDVTIVEATFDEKHCHRKGALVDCRDPSLALTSVTLRNNKLDEQELRNVNVSFGFIDRTDTSVTNSLTYHVGTLSIIGWDSNSNVKVSSIDQKYSKFQCVAH